MDLRDKRFVQSSYTGLAEHSKKGLINTSPKMAELWGGEVSLFKAIQTYIEGI